MLLIFSAVVISNVHWQWTPNGYLAGLIGAAVAFLVTVGAVRVADMLRRVVHWAAQSNFSNQFVRSSVAPGTGVQCVPMALEPFARPGPTSEVDLIGRHAVPSVSARSGVG